MFHNSSHFDLMSFNSQPCLVELILNTTKLISKFKFNRGDITINIQAL